VRIIAVLVGIKLNSTSLEEAPSVNYKIEKNAGKYQNCAKGYHLFCTKFALQIFTHMKKLETISVMLLYKICFCDSQTLMSSLSAISVGAQ